MSERDNNKPELPTHEPVNPADRDDSQSVNPAVRSGPSQQGSQSGQNQDLNTEYDPTNGKRHDQIRRNDKRGQMGG
ncbi:MAG TPA: hypothetical protein VE869_00315 [Gemmatimonas sp.]|nr:hypothetical protein [Gemmatimonas sp.]